MSYDFFLKTLQNAKDSDAKIKVSVGGLYNNVFFQNVWDVHELNLPTLMIRCPEVYETVKDRSVREALVLTGIFEVSRFKSPRGEDLEIELSEDDFVRFYNIITCPQRWSFEERELNRYYPSDVSPPYTKRIPKEKGYYMDMYRGKDAARVFVHAFTELFTNLGLEVDTNAEKYFYLSKKDGEALKRMRRNIIDSYVLRNKNRISRLLEIQI